MSASLDSDRLAVLVHEVRSPVAALSAIAETIGDDALDPEARRSLVKLVTVACRGIERIVADASVVSIRLEPVDLVELVGDVVSAARLQGADVELTAPTTMPRVDGDPSRLRQILDNLIVNALVHGGGAHEPVSVTVRVDSMIRIDVTDCGSGIPEEDLERIFEPRVRLDPEASAGSGLGLALGRAIAEGHGGSLTAMSAAGAGATFTLALPVPTD
jgi:signal transduction histidine kinase